MHIHQYNTQEICLQIINKYLVYMDQVMIAHQIQMRIQGIFVPQVAIGIILLSIIPEQHGSTETRKQHRNLFSWELRNHNLFLFLNPT